MKKSAEIRIYIFSTKNNTKAKIFVRAEELSPSSPDATRVWWEAFKHFLS